MLVIVYFLFILVKRLNFCSVLILAGTNCLATIYVLDAVGSSKFGNANGILNLFRGVGCIFGPYIAG